MAGEGGNGGALVVRPNAALKAFGPQPKMLGGLEDYTPGELGLRPLELRIVQMIRRATDVGKPGQLRIEKETFSSLTCVFLRSAPFRTYREPGDDGEVLCGSANGWVPLPQIVHPIAPACMERSIGGRRNPVCEYAKWDDGPNETRIPPPCKDGHALLGVRPDVQDKPFWFALAGPAAMEARILLQTLAQIPGAEHLAQFLITVTTKEEKGGKRNYYKPVFTVSDELIPVSRYAEMAAVVRDVYYTPFVTPHVLEPDAPAHDADLQPPEDAGGAEPATPEVLPAADDSDLPF